MQRLQSTAAKDNKLGVQLSASLTQPRALWQQWPLKRGKACAHLHPCGCTGFPGKSVREQNSHSLCLLFSSDVSSLHLVQWPRRIRTKAQCYVNKLGFIRFVFWRLTLFLKTSLFKEVPWRVFPSRAQAISPWFWWEQLPCLRVSFCSTEISFCNIL